MGRGRSERLHSHRRPDAVLPVIVAGAAVEGSVGAAVQLRRVRCHDIGSCSAHRMAQGAGLVSDRATVNYTAAFMLPLPAGGVLTVWACASCTSLVTDQTRHSEWHAGRSAVSHAQAARAARDLDKHLADGGRGA